MSATPNPRGARRREQILAATGELFSEQGFRGTSLSSVARRAGLTDAGLLHHFSSKEALLLAWLKQQQQAIDRGYEELLASGADFLESGIAQAELSRDRPEVG